MKRKILLISIIFVFFILIFNIPSYAGSQKLNNLEYDARLNEDGSVDIIEKWNIYVSDTNTLFKTFKLDSSKYGEITDINVKEISRTNTNFIETSTYAYHLQKGYYYGLKTKPNEFEIAWGVSIEDSANKVYEISYKIKDAVKTYNDCSEFYWQFIGTTNGIPADMVTGTIKLPKSVSNRENIKVWAHGPLNGEIQIVDNETVSFNVSRLQAKTMVEARVVTTDNIFSENMNIVNKDKLSDILKQEKAWADEANKKRDMQREGQEKLERILKGMIFGAVTIGIVIFVILVLQIIKYAKILSKTKEIEPEEKMRYFRDFPDENATPADAAYLYYFDKNREFKKNISKRFKLDR